MEHYLGNNVLELDKFFELKKNMSTNFFGWYFQTDVTHGLESKDPTRFGFRHAFYLNGELNSDYAHFVLPIIPIIENMTNKKLEKIHTIHANLTLNHGMQHNGLIHKDMTNLTDTKTAKRYAAVFYIDDSDGDTVFYDDNQKTEIHRQTPLSNSIIIFPANTYHSAFLPTQNPIRRVVNFNLYLANN